MATRKTTSPVAPATSESTGAKAPRRFATVHTLPVAPAAPQKASKPAAKATARTHLEAALEAGVRGPLRDAIKAALEIAEVGARRNLTDAEYKALRPGQKLVDPARPGFIARASKAGVRLLYRHNQASDGARVETLIGYLGDITLAEARERWAEMRARRMAGKPATEDRRSPDCSVPTMRELVRRYLAEYCERVKRSWKDDQRLLERHVLPAYGDLPADQFDTATARRLFASLDGTPRERDKLRASLSTLFNVSTGKTKKVTIADPWLPAGFSNPITNAETAKHRGGHTHEPTLDEARRYLVGLRSGVLRLDYAQALELQLLTASRISEVVGMAWSEVDLEAGRWTLPPSRSKNGEEHVVFLSAPALAILRARDDARTRTDEYVFPMMTDRRRPLRADLVSNALKEHRAALGVSSTYTTHACRVAFSTWGGERLVPQAVIHRCTAHVIHSGDAIGAIYNRARLHEPAAQTWRDWAEALGA